MLRMSPQDCYVVIQKTTQAMMDRLRQILAVDAVSSTHITTETVSSLHIIASPLRYIDPIRTLLYIVLTKEWKR